MEYQSMEYPGHIEHHVEVHKFHTGVVTGTVILALVLETFLLVHLRRLDVVELPLLVTIYFGLSRRNASAGLLLGMAIGVAQDSLSHTPLGLYGIAKTVVGFVASSIGARIDVEHPISRFALTLVFFHLHNVVFVLTKRLVLAQHEPFMTTKLVFASLVNAGVAVILFPLLDRFRKPS
jgi:rod shape-determining protein MreD